LIILTPTLMPLPNLSASTRRSIILVTTMLIGFYLGLSAIISLSYIGNTKESKLQILLRFDSTMRQLRSSTGQEDQLLHQVDSLGDLITMNSQRITDNYAKLKSLHLSATIDHLFAPLPSQVNQVLNQKNRLLEMYSENKRVRNMVLDQVQTKFHENGDKLSAGLLSDYAEKISAFTLAFSLDDPLNANFYQFNHNFLLVQEWMRNMNTQMDLLFSNIPLERQKDSMKFLPTGETAQVLPETKDYALRETRLNFTTLASIPKPDGLGNDWGPLFAFFIRYFARPNNIDVLLLIGMTGFGLFGSAISIYILRNPGDNSTAASHDLMLVIVRGFSAAIVVFLSIRGGIAILNKGESNPDPLILFLFCFIGAVFSDPIWLWAKKKTEDTFPSGKTASTATPSAAAASGARQQSTPPATI
jgi:hypothetical protein